ncbi:MAG TPA: NAD(+) synthase [Polyangiaceae bacterium]|nr:NAD(+) synthase [Polyangiaceae bacterium]
MFSKAVLQLDIPATISKIAEALRAQVMGVLHKRGVVVGLSGGIDSSVVAALAVRALGKERVLGLFMPEKDSADDSLHLGQLVAEELGIQTLIENIGPALAALGCYERQSEALRRIVPEFGPGWKFKLALPSIIEGPANSASPRLNVTQLTLQRPDGETRTQRMPIDVYLQIVAATNYKQRVRKMTEYYHADRLNYAVAGTPNRLEYDQGFFVKQGDGAADVKPIAHLYKTQVYALAEQLGIPAEIRARPPTTDTFSMPQTQEEFYFALPYDRMDVCLYAFNHGVPAAEVGSALQLTEEQVQRVFKDIAQKRKTTAYLHARPLLVEAVGEV